MGHTLPEGAVRHFTERRVHRRAWIWTLVFTDGSFLNFTDHDCEISFNGAAYSPVGAFTPESQTNSAERQGLNRAMESFISSNGISLTALQLELLDGAIVHERLIDWKYPWLGAYTYQQYRVISHQVKDQALFLEVAGLTERLRRSVGSIIQTTCELEWLKAGGRCGIANCHLAPVFDPKEIITRHSIDVSAVDASSPWLSKQAFTSSTTIINATNYPNKRDGYFNNSVIRWTTATGNNTLISRIAFFDHSTNRFELIDPLPNNITVADTFTLTGFKRDGCTVASVVDRATFTGSASDFVDTNYPEIGDDYFKGAQVDWSAGAHSGKTSRVLSYVHSTRTFVLELTLPFDITTSDTFSILEPCDRLKNSMRGCAGHNNRLNFFGSPYAPGPDKLKQFP